MEKRVLTGSDRTVLSGSQHVGEADANERIEAQLILRRSDEAAFQRRLNAVCDSDGSEAPLTRESYAQQFSASQADLDRVKAFAAQQHLQVVREDACTRTVVLAGTVKQFNDVFGTKLQRYHHPAGEFRGRTGPLHLPAELDSIVTAVLGLDNRPQANAHRMRPQTTAATSYTPLELAALYDFPDGDGRGQCVGIIELGGGFNATDLQQYFTGLGIASPDVVAVPVDGAQNSPTNDPNGADGEVMLDIEIAGALAPKARIAVYFAPNTDAGFVAALNAAVSDQTNHPSVISISWGSPEVNWTAQSINALDDALQQAAAVGVTVCVASGDNGSSDGVSDGAAHVDFPASSPYSLACGGTRLNGSGSTIQSETVWNDGANGGAGGGGVSAHFALPTWQKGLHVQNAEGTQKPLAKRGVPDVTGNADPQSGYRIRVDGQDTVVGGTSAVAPLWAGLIARVNGIGTGKTPLGYLNPRLYSSAPSVCRDIVTGNNGAFEASQGWDACTGLGSPNGKKLAGLS